MEEHKYLDDLKEIRQIMRKSTQFLSLSIVTAYLFSAYKARRNGETLVNATSKRALYNFALPLLTGGILCILLLENGHYGLLAPMTLIFYGLACVNVSKYTFGDVHYLGITEIVLGLFAVQFSGYGLLFWIIGFGVCHILYGSIMHFKYERNRKE